MGIITLNSILHKDKISENYFEDLELFKTGKYLYVVQAQEYNLNGVFQTESRFAYLTFQYKFSKGWQGDGKKRTKKNNKDSRLDFNNNGGGLK